MARGFDTLHVKSAVKSRNKFDLSRTHLTTMDFGQIVPLFCEETVPGDQFNVKGTYFSRMAPLVKPTYGKFSFRTMSTFVPYYQVCDGIDGYMSGSTIWHGTTVASRYINMQAILGLLTQSTYSTVVTSTAVASGAWYDLTYINNAGTQLYFKFTPFGAWAMKVLNSLGYSFHEGIDLQTGSAYMNAGLYTVNMSALPLLAFVKAYNDWMSQSQRYDSSALTSLLLSIKEDRSHVVAGQTYYGSTTHTITFYGLDAMFSNIKLCYENDYFTSAWQTANNPLSNSYTTGIKVPSSANGTGSTSDTVQYNTYDNYLNLAQGVNAPTLTSLGQRSLDFLKSFDDWVRRNNYSGARAVERVFSRFGIKTEDFRSNYAHVIDTDIVPIQVGDVTALSPDYVGVNNDNNVQLGDYAGKGIMSGSNGFSYKASDYGMLFVFGWYTVSPMMSFGFDKHVLRTKPEDYYNPEYDGIGAEPISVCEAFSNPRITGVSGDPVENATFGFTERYNSYRYGRDKITGEFRKYNLAASSSYANSGTEMNTWHTGRMLTDVRLAQNLLAQSAPVINLDNVKSEYNRIFSSNTGEDHFYMTAQFNVSAVRPMLSLNQVPRLGQGDTIVPKNGNEIN